jgi:hypothetical protein
VGEINARALCGFNGQIGSGYLFFIELQIQATVKCSGLHTP